MRHALKLSLALSLPSSALLAGAAAGQIQLHPPVTYGVGEEPEGGALIDFDGDGDLDLALSTEGPDKVELLRNAGGGAYEPAFSVPTGSGTSPEGLAAGDFDGDGDPDLAAALFSAGQVQLLLNQGGAAFTDAAADAGVNASVRARDTSVFLQTAECDVAVHLLVPSAARGPTVVHRFPDDSAGRTTTASGPVTEVTREGGCAVGTDGPERLVGHRTASVLRAGGGNDTLIARAGVTVMDGGPGADRFEAAGFTVYKSNNLPDGAGAGAGKAMIAGSTIATTLAEQIVSVEAGRMEKRFADFVKGLHVYGVKVTRPTGLVVADVIVS